MMSKVLLKKPYLHLRLLLTTLQILVVVCIWLFLKQLNCLTGLTTSFFQVN
jgi:hypothetical protein